MSRRRVSAVVLALLLWPLSPALGQTPAKIPRIGLLSVGTDPAGPLAYGPNFVDLFRRASLVVDKILRGARPADLPIEQPSKFDFLINLKTARTLGLTIPQSLLARADEVVQ
jgi:putative ABC transport system substrate-binding protein